MKYVRSFFIFLVVSFLCVRFGFAHCEIPCGIYDDQMRVDMIAEYITTIEKSMKNIIELSAEKEKNYNQLARWITNKEDHANKIQNIVYQYFLTQRIKPADKNDSKAYAKYVEQLTLLHQLLTVAMKAKQTTDFSITTQARELLQQFDAIYFERIPQKGKDRER